MSDLKKTNDGQVLICNERVLLCLEAAWELSALSQVLPDLVPNIDEAHGAHHAVRGVAGRFLQLSSVLMDALGDEFMPTAKLHELIHVRGGRG